MNLLNIIALIFIQVFSNTLDGTGKVNFYYNGKPLRSVLAEISTVTGNEFIYKDELVDKLNVTCSIKNMPPEKAIKNILSEYNISYKKFNEKYFVLFKEKRPAEENYKPVVIQEDIPVTNVEPVFSKPVLLSELSPVYPPEAVKNKIEGRVSIKFFITKQGDVSETEIQLSSGSSILDSATIDFVRRLKFVPAKANDKAQNTWMTMNFAYVFKKE